MCRLFAFSFHADTVNNSKHSFVDSFIKLSEHGAVLPTSSPGHHDGWGIVSYSSSKDIAVHYKSVSSAHCDTQFRSDVLFKDSNSRSGLVHLRKKTVGETLIENTHPFVDGVYSFIHNGTISHSGTYANLSAVCEGATDSERLFRRFFGN